MFEYLDFIPMAGKIRGRNLRLLTLSTCGYCRKARQFLEKNELEYLFVEVDSLDKSIRNRIRKDFYKAYRKIITYPTLLIGGRMS